MTKLRIEATFSKCGAIMPRFFIEASNWEGRRSGLFRGSALPFIENGRTRCGCPPERGYPTAETNRLTALLDFSTLTWGTTGTMNKTRTAETATVLQNGQVLFAGGESFDKGSGHLGRWPTPNCTRLRQAPA